MLQSFDFDELNPKAPGQHRGISIGSPTGTPVLAPVDATVTFAGTVPAGGKTLSLLTAQGLSVTLVHLGSFSVLRGATVAEGQEVGRVGPSGVSELTVPYVYLGVRRVEDPQGYLDPLLFLPTTQVPPAPVGAARAGARSRTRACCAAGARGTSSRAGAGRSPRGAAFAPSERPALGRSP